MINLIQDPNLNIVRNGLVFWLDPKFQTNYPGSGTTWTDISGFGQNMTFTNVGTNIIYDTANGNNFQYVPNNGRCSRTYVSGDKYDLALTGKITLEFWIKWDVLVRSLDGGIAFGLIYGNNTSGHMQWQFNKHIYGSPNKMYLIFAVYNTSTGYSATYLDQDGTYPPPVTISINTWYHVVCYYDQSVPSIGMYIDGQNGTPQIAGSNPASFALPGASFRSLTIGAQVPGFTNYQMDGNIGTVRIYDRVLSSDEINYNYNQQKVRFGK